MPSQTDVQQLVQGLTPGAVNNGNPNTVYNTAGTPMQPPQSRNPAWAQNMPAIPQSTAFGQWMLPGQWQAPTPAAPLNLPVWQLPQWNISGSPAGGGSGGSGGTGGGTTVAPNNGGGSGVGNPSGGGGAVETNGGTTNTGTTIFGDGGPFNQSFSIYDPAFKSAWGDPKGTGNLTPDTMNSVIQSLQQSGHWGELVDQKTGTLDWKQLLDMVTEPWFQSNMYLSGLNQWDTSNILAGIAQAVTGLPVNAIMNYFGQQQAFQGDDKNWLEQQLADHFIDNAHNDWAVAGGGAANDYIQSLADKYGIDPAQVQQILGIKPEEYTDGSQWTYQDYVDVMEGCVTPDSYIKGFGRAGDVKVGDTLLVIDPITFEEGTGVVSYSEAVLQPTVRITTKNGVVLECSKSAPIADDTGEQVRAEDLLGVSIPTVVNDMIDFDTVMKVEDLGEQMVQHITCENNFFSAGKEKDKYVLHHNKKSQNDATPLANGANAGSWTWAGGGSPSGQGTSSGATTGYSGMNIGGITGSILAGLGK